MIEISRKVDILSQVEIFSNMDESELNTMADDFHWVEYAKGAFIIQQGQKPRGLYVLTKGKVEAFINRESREPLQLNVFYPGDIFGETDLFSNKPAASSVICLEESQVLLLDAEQFAHLLVYSPKLHQGFMAKLSEKLNQANIGLWEARHREFLRSGLQLNQVNYKFYNLWGGPGTTKVMDNKLDELAHTTEHALLIGERGTGRQMMAWHIHKQQFGEEASFVVIDGGHLDQQWGDLLFDMEADEGNLPMAKGGCLLDLAEGGTLFIRDINLMSPRAQHKMAMALKYRGIPVRVIGSVMTEPEQLSVRLIPELKEHFTREFKLKSLRDRKIDIPYIAQGVFTQLAQQYNRLTPALDKEASKLLLTYNYSQGNDSELIDILERAFFLAEGEVVGVEHLFFGPTGDRFAQNFNLLSWNWFRQIVKKGIFPRWFQVVSFATLVCTLLILFFSPSPQISAVGLLLVWSLWWPTLVVSAFSLGRVWCGVCPVSMGMELMQKVFHKNLPVPNIIKKYDYLFTTVLFLLVFYVEGVSNLRNNPVYTGLWLLTILTAACITGVIFTRHTWCRHLCPLGGFIGMASVSGMFEVRANPEICLYKCTTHDCYRGTQNVEGCPMSHHSAYLDSNLECKLCLRCVRNCPHDAIKVNLRMPTREIWHLVRVNQGFAIFIGVTLAILLPITYYEPLHDIWSPQKWFFWYSIAYWCTAIIAGLLTWLIVRPFKTKAASIRIKLIFALIPMVVAGYIAYQLHFFPGANTIMVGIGYNASGSQLQTLNVPILRIGQVLAAILAMILTGITLVMVVLHRKK